MLANSKFGSTISDSITRPIWLFCVVSTLVQSEDPSAQEAIDEALDYLLDDSVDDINSGTIKQVTSTDYYF